MSALALTADPDPSNNQLELFIPFDEAGNPAQQFNVFNSASGHPFPLVAGSDPALFGSNLTDALRVADAVPLPREIGGVTVLLNDISAPLFFAAPNQVNFQVPWELMSERSAELTVFANGRVFGPTTIQTAPFNPAVFTTDLTGSGQGAVLVAGAASVAAPEGTFPGSRPARRGEFLSVFCNGLGPVDNPPPTGDIAPLDRLVATTHTVSATLGGVAVPVTFAGLAPGFVGLYQVNVEVAEAVNPGPEVPLILEIEGYRSNTVTVAVE